MMWYPRYVSMRTGGTVVKRSPAKSDKRLDRGDATRAALVTAARQLFGERGYAATSTEDVVAAAGVTKGALYHHFGGKQELFRVVHEQLLHEVSDAVVAIFNHPDPWRDIVDGCAAWIDAHRDPAVRRIVLTDARSVLDEDMVRDIEGRFGVVALRGALRKNRTAGLLDPATDLNALALVLVGALREACLFVAGAVDQQRARDDVVEIVTRMLESFRAPAT
jgi:AcrR family transcriptional regulator